MTQILESGYEKGTVRLLGEPSSSLAEGQHVKVLVEVESLDEERNGFAQLAIGSLAGAYWNDEPQYGRTTCDSPGLFEGNPYKSKAR
jgi:hypothetical protein